MADNTQTTIPGNDQVRTASAPHMVLAPYYRDPVNGAVYVHKDLIQVVAPGEDETHAAILKPVAAAEAFGDVESWAAYVLRFGDPAQAFLTWNTSGLRAVLDYHDEEREPGRCQWQATHKFVQSPALLEWVKLAGGQWTQKQVVEKFEDMADTIIAPSAADITGILSMLRSHVNTQATVTLKPDGGSKMEFSKDAGIKGAGDLPATITVRVPVLVGHVDSDGRAVTYDLTVRMRLTPTEQGVMFRFAVQNLEATLEDAYADRVAAARVALGDGYPILRAANT